MNRTTPARNRDEDGASAIEYGLLISGIAALVVAIVFAFGAMMQSTFSGSCSTVAGAVGTTC